MDLSDLIERFDIAKNEGWKYIGVEIQMAGFLKPEVIINPIENYEKKLEYYKKAYNNDLTLRAFNGIKIIGVTFGDSYNNIEKDFE
jgi:hypothetical protein